jgi:threonine dehydrogenase-like Zn-dependent dehydrogenase
MRAVVFEGERKVGVHDVAEPVITDARSAIVEVEQTSICGSDLHFYWGEFPGMTGVRPGHEFIGTVVALGAQVETISVGDRVMAMALYGCGECAGCASLRPTACSRGWVNFGTIADVPGGQAELVLAPHADHVLRRLPPWITADQAVLMTDVLPTGAYGAYNATIHPGSTVVVIGLGPIGLSAAVNALTYQPDRVLAFDSLLERRVRAERLGIEVFDPADAPVSLRVREETGGLGADSVIEAVGRSETLVEALRAARVGGTVAVLGIVVDRSVAISPLELGPRNLTVRFCTTDVPLMWEKLFPLLEAGHLEMGDLFTHRLPLSEAVRGYDIFANREDNVFKVVFDPRR